jgi:hypothetical protein
VRPANYVRALRRTAGHQFGPARVVASTPRYVSTLALDSDEQGRLTLAWTEEHQGDDRSVGAYGSTSAVLAATAAPGHFFGARKLIAAAGRATRGPLSVTAAGGRVALAWGYLASRRDVGAEAAIGPAGALGPVQTVATSSLSGRFVVPTPTVRVTLDGQGRATVVAVTPVQASDQLTNHLLAADGTA